MGLRVILKINLNLPYSRFILYGQKGPNQKPPFLEKTTA